MDGGSRMEHDGKLEPPIAEAGEPAVESARHGVAGGRKGPLQVNLRGRSHRRSPQAAATQLRECGEEYARSCALVDYQRPCFSWFVRAGSSASQGRCGKCVPRNGWMRAKSQGPHDLAQYMHMHAPPPARYLAHSAFLRPSPDLFDRSADARDDPGRPCASWGDR